MEAYSQEIRLAVLADCDAGMITHDVALKHKVSKAWVRRVKQRRREDGETQPRPPIKKTPPRWHAWKDRIVAFIREEQLTPTLSAGEIVVMDNLNSHKVAGIREAIEACGAALVYLPPYSPDLNPIELVFSKFKWLLRSAGERTVSGLWDLCGRLLDRFTATECQNYFRHCGYRYSDL